MLELLDINKWYGEQHVLRDLSLHVRQGEVVTLLGPSGCGKSTTLRLIAGIEKPSSGKIYLRDKLVNDLPPQKRNVGMVFQRWALFPHMTVFENIAFGLKIRKVPRKQIAQRVSEMIGLVKLSGNEHKFPSQLSGGMQQRVAFARALVVKPDILLLDEPFSNLDEKLRREMEVETRRIQQEIGITTLFVTHNQEEAIVMSDRIAVMKEGRIVEAGSPLEVYNNTQDPYVCTFLGDANLLEGEIYEVTDSNTLVRCEGIDLKAPAIVGSGVSGEKVLLAVRPERVKITQRKPAGPQDNCFPARIKDVIYKGPTVTYWVTAGRVTLQAVQTASEPADIPSPGDEVFVSFAATDLIVLKGEKDEQVAN